MPYAVHMHLCRAPTLFVTAMLAELLLLTRLPIAKEFLRVTVGVGVDWAAIWRLELEAAGCGGGRWKY